MKRRSKGLGTLLLAPMVIGLRMPRLFAEAGQPASKQRESRRAVTEKVEAAVVGAAAAQASLFASAVSFWPRIIAGRKPASLGREAAKNALGAALRPAAKTVGRNAARLSKAWRGHSK